MREGVAALLIGAVAYNAAIFTYRLAGVSTTEGATASAVAVPGRSTASAAVDVAPLVESHLFGRAELGSELAPVAEAVQAPETRLNLKLTGLVATGTAKTSVAIISSNNGPERSYRIGDSIGSAAGVILHAIESDYVVLMRNGKQETLRLPKPENLVSSAILAKPSGGTVRQPSGRPSGALSQRLSDFRQKVVENPSALFSEVQVKPVMADGRIRGYELNSPQNQALLQQAGIMQGDVITHVNGLPLTNAQSMTGVFDQLRTADRIDVTLERNGQPQSVTIDMGE